MQPSTFLVQVFGLTMVGGVHGPGQSMCDLARLGELAIIDRLRAALVKPPSTKTVGNSFGTEVRLKTGKKTVFVPFQQEK
jgi:hypothetical protein